MRISFGGGGSEIDPFMHIFGGRVMNSTISIYAHTLLVENSENIIQIESSDTGEVFRTNIEEYVDISLSKVPKNCVLVLAALQYFAKELTCIPAQGIKISTHSDAPVGSGLGASSTMTVSVVHTLLEYFKLPSDPYSLASAAHKVEREYLGLAGGLQDHFCAAFGGFNFMEFGPSDHLLINPLRIKRETLFELESSLLLIYTGTSRDSANIIQNQIISMDENQTSTSDLLKQITNNAFDFKSAILKWDLNYFASLLNEGWQLKKLMSKSITNSEIDELTKLCLNSGALGSKLCGAGGGGYLLVVIKPENRRSLLSSMTDTARDIKSITFVEHGSEVWHSTAN